MKNLVQISIAITYLLVSFVLIIGNEQIRDGISVSICSDYNVLIPDVPGENSEENSDFPILEKEGTDESSVSAISFSLNGKLNSLLKHSFIGFVEKVKESAINIASPPPQQA